MPEHQTPLIATIAAGLMLAYVFGLLAHRLRIPPLVGYLLAGVRGRPVHAGLRRRPAARRRARRDRRHPADVRRRPAFLAQGPDGGARASPCPARCCQIVVATLLGHGLGPRCSAGRSAAGLVFGLALSVASTVVLLRALQDARICSRPSAAASRSAGWSSRTSRWCWRWCCCRRWRDASGNGEACRSPRWSLSGCWSRWSRSRPSSPLMLVVGRRVIPWLMHYTAHTGSRELFTLAVYAIALGVAFGAAKLFGVSFALGAFFAGMVMGESHAQPARGARRRCRCATPSRCCSSSRSACCSTRAPGRGAARGARGARASSSSASRWSPWPIVRAFRLLQRDRADDRRRASRRSASSRSSWSAWA